MVLLILEHLVSTRLTFVITSNFEYMNLLKPALCGFFILSGVNTGGIDMAKNVIISTELGDLTLELNYEIALHTAGYFCLSYISPRPRDRQKSRMPSSA